MEKCEGPSHVLIDGEHHRRITILLLTREHCGFCEQAQETLERLSREYWLSVSTLEMDSPEGRSLPCEAGCCSHRAS
jgi:thiol-disulfide isomerase/thioredoxin